MSLVVSDVQKAAVLTAFFTPAMTMRLYGNNVTPDGGEVAADFTEIAGGGYAAKPLTFANWGFTTASPAIALYNAVQGWGFTGAINAPSTIYGYFITRDSDGLLMYAERFPSGVVPFTPIDGSIIRVTPRMTCAS